MAGVETRDFTAPDGTRTPDKTTVELVNHAGGQISLHVPARLALVGVHQARVGTDSCQVEHVGYVVSGTLHVKHEDRNEGEAKPGDVYRIAPSHDAWVVGDEGHGAGS